MAGSIEKRGENSWRLIVSCGMDANGKQIKKTRTIKASSPKEAEKALALFVAEIEKGQYIDPTKLSLSDFVERWIKDYAETNLAPKTLLDYKKMLNSRILPAMGHIKIEKIKPTHLLGFYANLQEDGIRSDGKYSANPELISLIEQRHLKIVDLCEMSGLSTDTIKRIRACGFITFKTAQALSSAFEMELDTLFKKHESGRLSDKTISKYHQVLSSILQDAVQWQIIPSNPASRVKPPKVSKKAGAYFDEE